MSHALYPLPPSLCHKLSHLLGPLPPSSMTYFMDGPVALDAFWRFTGFRRVLFKTVGTWPAVRITVQRKA